MNPDTVLGGRYRLISRIAAGGMGEVWRALDESLGREVAVKVMHSHVAADPSFRTRFRTEARITAALTDPGIAQVYDYGESDSVAYLVMELVHGEPLAAILSRNGALDPQVTLDIIEQAAKGLYAAHRNGVIHRDIKPGNLLVTEDGQVKITDFGIARALEAARLTRTGTVLGTAQYVSPEQASGSELTPASDIYSLGVVAYECLAGRPPFTADTPVALVLKHINTPPPPLPETVPQAVRDLVSAMLAKDPAARPADGAELARRVRALRATLTGEPARRLGALTDPSGFPVARTAGLPPQEPRDLPTTKPELPETAAADPGPGSGRRTGRRPVIIGGVVAGCALAAVIGVLAPRFTESAVEPPRERPASPTPEVSPTPVQPSRSPAVRPTQRVVQVPSATPFPTPSATVITSAPATWTPTPSASPTPSLSQTPPSTPTHQPTDTAAPTASPTETSPPDDEGTDEKGVDD